MSGFSEVHTAQFSGFVLRSSVRTIPIHSDTCEPETFIDFLRRGGDLRRYLPYQTLSSGTLANVSIRTGSETPDNGINCYHFT